MCIRDSIRAAQAGGEIIARGCRKCWGSGVFCRGEYPVIVGGGGQRTAVGRHRNLVSVTVFIIGGRIGAGIGKGSGAGRCADAGNGCIAGQESVSYTHLDVYKRQDWRS